MVEIGSGQGSAYPGGLDTNAQAEVNASSAGKTKARAEVVEDLAACIVAIETELGTDPAGSKATLVARLVTSLENDGSPKDTVIVTVSGQNQQITGHKVFASGISTGIWGITGTGTIHQSGIMVVTQSGSILTGGSGAASGYSGETGIPNFFRRNNANNWNSLSLSTTGASFDLTTNDGVPISAKSVLLSIGFQVLSNNGISSTRENSISFYSRSDWTGGVKANAFFGSREEVAVASGTTLAQARFEVIAPVVVNGGVANVFYTNANTGGNGNANINLETLGYWE